MNYKKFESKVLELWVKTRVRMTLPHILVYTQTSRAKAEPWLDEMVKANTLDMDIVGDELEWRVIGADRPSHGPKTLAEIDTMSSLEAKASKALAKEAGALALRRGSALIKAGEGQKSLLASGLLSFFFGPLGWLYAGSWREAVPAAAIYALVLWIIPSFLLWPLAGLFFPASALAGLAYAWRFNRTGERQNLLPKSKDS